MWGSGGLVMMMMGRVVVVVVVAVFGPFSFWGFLGLELDGCLAGLMWLFPCFSLLSICGFGS
jgi:hypothetical protein